MRTLAAFISRALSWIGELTFAGYIAALPISAILFALVFGNEWAFRYGGAILELAGIGTVAYGIADTRRRFDQPSLWKRFRAWLGRRPGWKPKTHTVSLSGTLHASTFIGAATLTSVVPDDWPVDRQLKAFKQELKSLNESLAKDRNEAAAATNEVSVKLESEAATRAQRDVEMETLIRTAQVGGLDLSLMGLVWLAVGLLMTTASQELVLIYRNIFG